MGILDRLFGKKQSLKKEEVTDKPTPDVAKNESSEFSIEKLKIDTSQTAEKFVHMTDEVIDVLIPKLQEINALEQEIFERSRALKNPQQPHQLQSGERELWEEFKVRRKHITDSISLSQSEEGSRSFGKPTKYEYLRYPETQIYFIMKSSNRAVVEIIYEYGIKSKDQFVLKKEGTNWKVESKKYGYPDESTWHKDEL